MSGLMPPTPLSYDGLVAVPFINKTFPPTTAFNQFNVPTLWADTTAMSIYCLVAKPLGVAKWVHLGGVPGELDTITTPDSTVVVPTANNINFLNGTAVNITGSGSSITFNAIGGGWHWNDVTSATQTLSANNGYIAHYAAGPLVFSLPATANVGDAFAIMGFDVGGWTVAQNAGQVIILGNKTSTTGVPGSIASTLESDNVVFICVGTNTTFKALNWTGNILVT